MSGTLRVALDFPPDLTAEQVETLLGSIAGLPARARVLADAEGHGGKLAFYLEAHPSDVTGLRAGLQGVAPGVRLEEAEFKPLPRPRLRAYVSWRGTFVLLRDDQRELAVASLL